MFIKTSLWALMLGSMNLQELKYGYIMDTSVGGFPSHLHICSLVYNKSWPKHHSCHLHVLNIHMRGLYFTSSPLNGFAALRHSHTQTHSTSGKGFSYFLSVQEKKLFFYIWTEKLSFYNTWMKSAYLWLLTLSDCTCICRSFLVTNLDSFCSHSTGWNFMRLK